MTGPAGGRVGMVEGEDAAADHQEGLSTPPRCPECGGTLWESESGGALVFRCRVGHRFGPGSLLASQREAVERALWATVVALEERAELCERVGTRLRARILGGLARRSLSEGSEARRQAEVVRAARDGALGGAEEDGR